MKSTSQGKENLGQHLQESIGSYVQVWKAEQEGVRQGQTALVMARATVPHGQHALSAVQGQLCGAGDGQHPRLPGGCAVAQKD